MNIMFIIPSEHVCPHLILTLFSFPLFFFFFSSIISVHDTRNYLTALGLSWLHSSPTTIACVAQCLLTVTHLLWPWCTGDRLLWDSLLRFVLWRCFTGDGDRADARCRPLRGGDLDLDNDRGIAYLLPKPSSLSLPALPYAGLSLKTENSFDLVTVNLHQPKR